MSVQSSLAVHSHVYGSTPRGFATLYVDDWIEESLLRVIMRRCSYSLPVTVAGGDPGQAPIKYLYGLVGSRAFVGRARYLGVDLTGRLGNYVCHCLAFDLVEAETLFDSPLALLASCEAQDVFTSVTPREGQAFSPLQVEARGSYLARGSNLPNDVLVQLVSVAISAPSPGLPVIIKGSEEDVIDTLEGIFSCLSFSQRWGLAFDTYGFGGLPQGVAFSGLPAGSAYTPVPPHSATVDVTERTIVWTGQQHPLHPLAELVCNTSPEPKQRAILLSAVDLIASARWDELPDTLSAASPEVLLAVYKSYRKPLLGRTAATGDRHLATVLDGVVLPEDLDCLDGSLRADMVRVSGSRTRERLVREVAAKPGDRARASLALADERLLESCLAAAREAGTDFSLLTTLLGCLTATDASWAEVRLIEYLLEKAHQPLPREHKAALRRAIEGLPRPEPALAAHRALAEYLAGDASALARHVLAARASEEHWERSPGMVRFVVAHLGRVQPSDALSIVVELMRQIPEGSSSISVLDRALASFFGNPESYGAEAGTAKKLGRKLGKQGVLYGGLPATKRVLGELCTHRWRLPHKDTRG